MITFLKKKIKSLKRFFIEFPKCILYSTQISYYPELKRRNIIIRVFDNIIWLIKNNEANYFYTLYGLDIHYSCKYKDYYSFMNQRNNKNVITSPFSYSCLLRDKYLFSIFMTYYGINTPKIFALINCSGIYDLKYNLLDIDRLDFNACFIKDVKGECASFVKKISDLDQLKETVKIIDNRSTYILQELIIQHEKLSNLYQNSINTLRIVTINNNETIEVFSSILRIGTKISGNVDNWAAGGLAVGIDKDGKLKKYGYYKPCYGIKVDVHPDTKIEFEGYSIPMYLEAEQLAIEAHKKLCGIHSIGWDIAITKNGPTIIEGNDNWEISLMQACNGPLKEKWDKYI